MNFLKGQQTAKKSSQKQLWYLKRIAILLFFLTVLPFPVKAADSDRYVSPLGRDESIIGVPNDCLSTSLPCRSIQHAIDVAEWRDVIKVQSAIYTENIVVRQRKSDITIEGGWNQDFTARYPDPWFSTTISGLDKGPVFDIWAKGESIELTIDGFTLKDGNASSSPDRGGALRVRADSDDNGIYSAHIIITLNNNRILENRANLFGGAISAQSISPDPGFGPNGLDLILTNNVFTNNQTSSYGGAIFAYASGSSGLWVELIDNVIENNYAGRDGGGIGFLHYSDTDDRVNISLKRNIIRNNVAGDKGGGLALLAWGSGNNTMILENNLIARNRSTDWSGGGIFVENKDGDVELSLLNDTITDNTSYQFAYGAGIALSTSGWGFINANLINEIVWGNNGSMDLSLPGGGIVNVSYSNIGTWGGGGTYNEGDGVINVNPLFVNISNANYHLKPNSPVRDIGICETIHPFIGGRIAPFEDFEDDSRPDPGILNCQRWIIDQFGKIICVEGTYLGCDMGADEFVAGKVTLPGISLLLLSE